MVLQFFYFILNHKMTNKEHKEIVQKILMTGYKVGKSSILHAYEHGEFIPDLLKIGVDFVVKRITINDTQLKLQIWDPTGSERYRNISKMYYRNTHGVIVIYDATNRESFEELNNWIEDAHENCMNNTKFILVGNKYDRTNDIVVSTQEAEVFADKKGMLFYEASAKDNLNIEQIFTKLINLIHDEFGNSP